MTIHSHSRHQSRITLDNRVHVIRSVCELGNEQEKEVVRL